MCSKIKVKYPLGIQWKIPENELQKLRSSVNGYLDSKRFQIPETDVNYCVRIYPNNYNDEQRGNTRISLRLEFEEKKEIEAEFSIFIASANFSRKFKYVYKESHGCGRTICTTDELFDPENRFIVDGEIIIKIEGFLMIEKNATTEVCKLGGNGHKLSVNLWNHVPKDFTIVADGKEIEAHKIVLTAHSPVFAAMFQPHPQEAQENRITIPDFTFDVVDAAIKFCYDSSLVGNVTFDDQMSLLQFFDKYDMDSLTDDLEKHIIAEINETSVCRLTNSSIISNALKLRRKYFEFLLACIKNGKPVNDFDLLDKDFAFDLLKNSLLFSG